MLGITGQLSGCLVRKLRCQLTSGKTGYPRRYCVACQRSPAGGLSAPSPLLGTTGGRQFYSKLPPHFKVPLPALSPTMMQGTVVKWEKQVGDVINEGDLLCEIETDKATMGFETPEEGFMARIFVEDGTKDLPIGQLLCIIAENKDDIGSFSDYVDDGVSPITTEAVKEEAPPPSEASMTSQLKSLKPVHALNTLPIATSSPSSQKQFSRDAAHRIMASPLAKKIARERGIDLSTVVGSGPNKRIVKGNLDDTAYGTQLVQQTPDLPSSKSFSVQDLLQRAHSMMVSKTTIPHYYLSTQIDLTAAERLIAKLANHDQRDISLLDIFIKGAAVACMKVPEANSSWLGDHIRQYSRVDIDVTAQTADGRSTSLLVKQCDVIGLAGIAQCLNLHQQSQTGSTLLPVPAGSFSLTTTDSVSYQPIINAPHSCHLAIGSPNLTLVHNNGQFVEANVSVFTLSCDHRVIDGAVGAAYLRYLKMFLEDPATMLV